MKMKDLILRFRVEEDHKKGDKNDVSTFEAKANFIEGMSLRQRKLSRKTKAREKLLLMHQRANSSKNPIFRAMYVKN